MNSLDHLQVSLEGRKLIESSAGTGKTYAIASLYVRLLLQQRLQTGEILVVTFTEAATDDLRRRIREQLRSALTAFGVGRSEDLFLARLLQQTSDIPGAKSVLSAALQSFDEAAIFTIHGFCQRILQEEAFETASLFDTELVTEQRHILQEVVDDFWRLHFYGASRGFLQYTFSQHLSPKKLVEFLGNSPSNPFLTLIPELNSSAIEAIGPLEDEVRSRYEEARQVWIDSRGAIQGLLATHPGLNRRTYSENTIARNVWEMERYLSAGNPFPMSSAVDRLSHSVLSRAAIKGHFPPGHRFFSICEELKGIHSELTRFYDLQLIRLKSGLFRYVKSELRERKQQQNVRFFDDLLLDLYSILQSPRGAEVAEAIRNRYKAVLIDEFQDTDPVQYTIFRSAYNHPEASLFLIGDPKQAIYSFRGADIFAYIRASSEVAEKYTLTQNWRSTAELIAATNAIFARAEFPFVFPEIEFHPAEAATQDPPQGFTWAARTDPSPFKIWFVDRNDGQEVKPINKTEANQSVAGAVASEILQLLMAATKNVAQVNGQPLSSQDIAVLVRTNREARLIQEALQELNIPSVLYSEEGVFASQEAEELVRILAAILDPTSESKVKTALATDIFGIHGNELALLSDDDIAWDKWLKTFTDYRDLWDEQGLMTMARVLLARQDVSRRLLSFTSGERRLTNLLHCFELLHRAVLKHSLGMNGLLQWLAERREDGKVLQSEEHQLRLETDEKAVKVVTIHKSKGLEYSVVFCPFCWNIPGEADEDVVFHDENDPSRIIKDIGSDRKEENRRVARQESLAESIRLLYVALTRAKYRCYLVWGAFRDAGKSSIAYLLHSAARTQGLYSATAEAFEQLNDTELKAELAELVEASGRRIELLKLPQATNERYSPPGDEVQSYPYREFHGGIAQNWGIASFTSLVSGKRHGGDTPDRDLSPQANLSQLESTPQTDVRALTIFDFPRGTRAGNLFHEIFQSLDFEAGVSPSTEDLVREKLAAYGFERVWQQPVCQMIDHVLTTSLDSGRKDFQLCHLAKEEKLHEVEFTLPLDLLTSARLSKVFARHQAAELPTEFPEKLRQLGFTPVRGLMKGYIDMIFRWEDRFYLVDWKSNFLGHQLEAYRQDSLLEVMQREVYILQYTLYCVALHRYLTFRLADYDYENHFGGVFYLFLRGVDSERGPECGIYRARPSWELVTELSRCLSDRES